MQFFNSISITLQQHERNCFTVNMNENKTGVITQIIPRYTSEYYGNLDYNYQMQKRSDKARVRVYTTSTYKPSDGPGLEILLGLN